MLDDTMGETVADAKKGDSNKSRADRRKVDVYLSPEEGELLECVAEKMGETLNTVIRTPLRAYLRKVAVELGIDPDNPRRTSRR